MGGHGVHIYVTAQDRDTQVCSRVAGQINVFHVIDHIDDRGKIRVPGQVEDALLGNVIAEIDIAGIEIGDDQVEIVDELDAGGRVAGGIGPDKSDSDRVRLAVGVHDQRVGVTRARGQSGIRVLVEGQKRGCIGCGGISQCAMQDVRDICNSPALRVQLGVGVQVVKVVIDGSGSVDEQRFHESGAVGSAEPLLEKLLHQRESACDLGGGHARSRFVAVEGSELIVESLEHFLIVAAVGRCEGLCNRERYKVRTVIAHRVVVVGIRHQRVIAREHYLIHAHHIVTARRVGWRSGLADINREIGHKAINAGPDAQPKLDRINRHSKAVAPKTAGLDNELREGPRFAVGLVVVSVNVPTGGPG